MAWSQSNLGRMMDPDALLPPADPMRDEDYRIYTPAEIQAMPMEQYARVRKVILSRLREIPDETRRTFNGAIDLRIWTCMWCAEAFQDQVTLEAHEEECM